ncbi:MAG: CRTAC1 family protein [Betaproteobacteria bacterium]
MRATLALLASVLLGAVGLALAQGLPSPSVLFRDVAGEAGVAFQHQSAPEKKYIMESMSGGVALLDYDGDGLVDVYLTNSLTVDSRNDPKAARSVLYRNLGGFRFEDVTDKAGVGHPGWAMGVCVGDVDGDGAPDLYVTGLGRNYLYRNNRDGTFSEIAAQAGVAASGWSTGCGFADYDRDGRLDLFVSRYVHVDLDNLPEFGKGTGKGEGRGATCQYRGVAVQCGPRGLPGEPDLLFHNDGSAHFSEVSERAGVRDTHEYYGLGIAWFDYDGDGWPDLYVANDSQPNYLYHNQGDGTFKEVGFPAGVAVSEDGSEQGSMGIALGDYTNSGRPSLFVTNFGEEYNALFRNDGEHFTDVSFRSKTAPASLPLVMWGTAFLDYDNDGWEDLIAVAGHVYPQMDQVKTGASAGYRQPKLLYHNRQDGTFDEVSRQFGPALTEKRVSRGLAVGDLDDDGRLDVVVNDLDGPAQVLRNELAGTGGWLTVRLEGKPGNTLALGAVVTVKAGPLSMTRTVRSGTSYISQDDTRQHFGLGAQSQADLVEVRWPDQSVTRLSKVAANRVLVVKQP